MIAKIEAERIIHYDEKAIRIKSIEGVIHHSQLPGEYLSHYPHFWKDANGTFIVSTNDNTKRIYPGNICSPEDFNEIISSMKQSGERLTAINKKLKLRSEHHGTFTVKI